MRDVEAGKVAIESCVHGRRSIETPPEPRRKVGDGHSVQVYLLTQGHFRDTLAVYIRRKDMHVMPAAGVAGK